MADYAFDQGDDPAQQDDVFEVDCASCGGRYDASADQHPREGWLCGPCSHGEKSACRGCGCWEFKTDMFPAADGWRCDECEQRVYQRLVALAQNGGC